MDGFAIHRLPRPKADRDCRIWGRGMNRYIGREEKSRTYWQIYQKIYLHPDH